MELGFESKLISFQSLLFQHTNETTLALHRICSHQQPSHFWIFSEIPLWRFDQQQTQVCLLRFGSHPTFPLWLPTSFHLTSHSLEYSKPLLPWQDWHCNSYNCDSPDFLCQQMCKAEKGVLWNLTFCIAGTLHLADSGFLDYLLKVLLNYTH